MTAGGYPVSLEKAFISAQINSTLLTVLLWGIYTVAYIGTLYLYLNKESSGNRLVVGAISVSYVGYSVLSILSWYLNQVAIVNSGTRDTLFAALVLGSEWPSFVNALISFTLAAVADGILIWRCLNVWGRSLWAIAIPACLLFVEITLDLVITIFWCADHLNPSSNSEMKIKQLIAAQAFTTFGSTLASTVLIAYRIYTAAKQDIPRSSKRRFMQIAEILVQSAAAYALAAIAEAIPLVFPLTLDNQISLEAAGSYTSVLFVFISGVAPTVLVARVAALDDRDTFASTSISMPVSDLQFQARTVSHGGSQIQSVASRIHTDSLGVEFRQT